MQWYGNKSNESTVFLTKMEKLITWNRCEYSVDCLVATHVSDVAVSADRILEIEQGHVAHTVPLVKSTAWCLNLSKKNISDSGYIDLGILLDSTHSTDLVPATLIFDVDVVSW